ncbi:DUF2190 family protein [Aureimonas glaciei]|uniref:DUF2190 family protein n=1 Tax=Aureimonas glaciei TaxID=1776957 RepID=A0A916XU93_9HYPH|nr:DUF2190 family protein [Aureimonas glaciei]GGD12068.1 hypothetical protein GCM10011335_13720 [Aureimonas glaciei]
MKNFKQHGVNLTVDAPYSVVSGGGVLVGTKLFGVASDGAAEGETVVIVTEGVFAVVKPLTDVFAIGSPVYWNNATKVFTATATGNAYVGVAYTAAPNPSDTVEVRLNGFIA